jgi:hypothetical protein
LIAFTFSILTLRFQFQRPAFLSHEMHDGGSPRATAWRGRQED